MTKHRDRKTEIRERMARTGEAYNVARRAIEAERAASTGGCSGSRKDDLSDAGEIAAMTMNLPLEWAEAVRKLGSPVDDARSQLRLLRQGGGDLNLLERALDDADRILDVLSGAEMGMTAGELQRELGFPPFWPGDDEEPEGWDPEPALAASRREYRKTLEAQRQEPGRSGAAAGSDVGEPVSDDAVAEMERQMRAKIDQERKGQS